MSLEMCIQGLFGLHSSSELVLMPEHGIIAEAASRHRRQPMLLSAHTLSHQHVHQGCRQI